MMIEALIEPRPSQCECDDDVHAPQWEEDAVGAASAGAPVLGEWVNAEPEEGDCAIDGTEEPGEISKDQHSVLEIVDER